MAEGWARYEARGEIARGPSGRVFLAVDTTSRRQVAIKELSAELTGVPGFLPRFRAEAEALTRLESANCVRVLEFFEQDSRAFLVQEYLEGASLRQVATSAGTLRPEQALGVMKGILSGLGYAHALGVMHGDLKPESVLVDGGGLPRVTDFGQPLPLSGPGAAGGIISGTPAYMSPERVRGDTGDARSDLYSAGIMLFELLTGRLPYQASSAADMMRAQVEAPIPDPRDLAPHVPDDVAFLVGRAITKDPASRPQDALTFYNELVAAAAAGHGRDWEARSSIAALVPAAAAAALAMVPVAALAATESAPAPVAPVPVAAALPSSTPQPAGVPGRAAPPRIHPVRALIGLVLGVTLVLGGLGYGGSHGVLPAALASASLGAFSPPAGQSTAAGAGAVSAVKARPAVAASGASNTVFVLDVSGSMSSAAVIPAGFPRAAELKQKQDAFGSLVEQVKGGKKIPVGAIVVGVSGVVDLIQLQKELNDYLTAHGTDPATISKLAALKVSTNAMLAALAAEHQDLGLAARVGLVKFSDSATVLAPIGADFNSGQAVVSGLQTEASTNMGDGLQNALQLLSDQPGGKIVLLTDGWNNTGMTNEQVLSGPVATAAAKGIPVCTIGLGESPFDVDQALLSDIAARTGGDYYFVGDRVSVGADMLSCHHAEAGQKVVDFRGRVHQDQAVPVPAVAVPGGKRRLSLTVYWPGSELDLVVRDPSGRPLGDRGYGLVTRQPGLIAASLANPPAGIWSVEVRGKQVSTGGEDFFVSGAVDGSTPGQHFDSVVRGGPGGAGPFSELRDRFRVAITLGALVGGIAMLLMTVRGLARRIRGRRLRQRLPGKFLVPAALYLGVIGGLGVLLVAAAANYLWETPLIQPPPI